MKNNQVQDQTSENLNTESVEPVEPIESKSKNVESPSENIQIDLKALIKNGVHFGHQTSRWSPKMRPYIWGAQNGIHLIDVSQTANKLAQAAKFLESVASEGKVIVWVGTKKAAQSIIQRIGKELKQPYVSYRWVGGTFTNNGQVRKAIVNLLHFEDILNKTSEFSYSKKEKSVFQKRIDRLEKNVGGIRQLRWPVGAVVVVDIKKEHVCIKEAIVKNIPVVAIVDTNCDPSNIDYVIPGNDDVPRSIDVMLNYLAQAVQKGLQKASIQFGEQLKDITDADSGAVLGLEEEDESENKKRRPRALRRTGNTRAKPGKFIEKDSSFSKDASHKKEVKSKVPRRGV